MLPFLNKYRLILIGISCGLIAVVIDATIDSTFFSHEPFLEELLEPGPFEIYIRTVMLGMFALFSIYVQYTTNRLQQQNQLLNKLSTAINQADESVIITDHQTCIEYVNPAFSRITGYSADEVIGQKANILKSGKHDHEFYRSMWTDLHIQKKWHGKIYNRRKDASVYPAMMSISPIVNKQGEITHYIGLEQEMEKIEELEQQFFQAQKMEAIGTLVGGIAHDFNNTLAAITGNLFLVKEDVADKPEVVSQLSNIERLSFSAAQMIQQLLAFSRKGIVKMQPVFLATFLKEISKLSRNMLPSNIELTHDITPSKICIQGDVHQLHQVVLNLINNARDALEGVENPAIRIKLDTVAIDDAYVARHPEARVGQYACISVSDNGGGMDEQTRQHIFEPFFTTKEVGKGTGLGLSMAYGAMQGHDGFITVEHKNGTTFNLFFPLIKHRSEIIEEVKHQLYSGHGETILVVDDNISVLTTMTDILTRLNYKSKTAPDGEIAVEIYKRYQDEIDLIIMDTVMPKLDGINALQSIRAFDPDVAVLFVSGYQRQSKHLETEIMKGETLISKPFSIHELSRVIHHKIKRNGDPI